MPTRVMIVDDSPGDRRLIRQLLDKSSFGEFQTIECQSGADAIARAMSESIDCILLDYSMPGLDGLETLRELKRRQIDTPAIFLTEY
ncbi:MAG: response regulator, partial [Alphaproteobacteria bacterium]